MAYDASQTPPVGLNRCRERLMERETLEVYFLKDVLYRITVFGGRRASKIGLRQSKRAQNMVYDASQTPLVGLNRCRERLMEREILKIYFLKDVLYRITVFGGRRSSKIGLRRSKRAQNMVYNASQTPLVGLNRCRERLMERETLEIHFLKDVLYRITVFGSRRASKIGLKQC